MAEKILNTRIQLRYDTYANWTTNNPILKKGEMAIATIETGNTEKVNSVTPPQVLIKVGDGSKHYSELPFASALAADVYSWAKKNDTEFISWLNTQIGNTYDTKGSAAQALSEAKSYTDALANGAVATNTQAISDITDGTSINSFSGVETALAGKQAAGDYATKAEAKGYADAKDTAIAEAKKAGTDAQATIDTYKTANDAAVAAIKSTADAAATKTYVDTELGKKQDNLVFNTAYDKDNNKVATMTDITNATADLSGAMHFKGIVASDPTSAEFDKSSYKAGDVVLFGNKEYVFNTDNNFVELGDEGSYVLKTTKINGHALSGDITISKSDVGLGNVDNKSESTIKSDFTGSIAENNEGFVKGGDAFTALAGKSDTGHKHVMSDITDLDVGVTAVAEGKTNGTVSVTKGGVATDVSVHGLGSAAYTDASAYATAAQGTKADAALQEITTTANAGLKVTNKNQIDIDNTVTFIFDCGNASGGSLQD